MDIIFLILNIILIKKWGIGREAVMRLAVINIVFAIIGGVILGFVVGTSLAGVGGFLGFLLLWVIGGLPTIYILVKREYLTIVGLMLVFILGWWILALGPLLLIGTTFLPERKRCTHCQELINKDATRCPKCQGDLSINKHT